MKFSYLVKACVVISLLAMAACSDDDGIISTSSAPSGPDPFVITPVKTAATKAPPATSTVQSTTAIVASASDFIPGDATGCCGTGCTVSCEVGSTPSVVAVDLGSASAFIPGDAEGCCGTGCTVSCEAASALSPVGSATTGLGSAFIPGDAEGCCGTGCKQACD